MSSHQVISRLLSFLRNLNESIRQALSSLRANKLRALLTLVGVIIGVMTIIAVVSIITGMNKYVAGQLASLGPTTFFIDKWGLVMSEDEWWKAMKRKEINLDDMRAIASGCPSCEEVGALAQTNQKVKYRNQHLNDVEVKGITANMEKITDIITESGYSPTDFDVDHHRQVALIGWELKDKLFGAIDPLGKEIKIGDDYFTVIGVAKKRGSFLGENQDNFVRIPITTFHKLFYEKGASWNYWFAIFVKASDYKSVEKAQDEARLILRARRHLKYHDADDFGIKSSETFMDLWKSFTFAAFFVMIVISCIALLVGGIGIMNIMLVSVRERTKEIGIRKAVGAKRKNILSQFLAESATISVVGGIIGILAGFSIAKIISMTVGLPSTVSAVSVIAGIVMSFSVGMFFGVYPAMKAAKMDPIEALRYE
ncbi:MAG: ABC efflux pump, inner membrane subunit [candidate division Zixibacteria bacterium RBG-1]|nr:MAG: ABC efflux pump, inner membrane subunit [candidate division Zixibacteria bacterium RBG-1]